MTHATLTAPATSTPAAGPVETAWLATGWVPGIPPGLTAEALAVDVRLARFSLRCPCCRRRGLTAKAFTRLGRYRMLAVCNRHKPEGGGRCPGEVQL
jgi:hypothetical protein